MILHQVAQHVVDLERATAFSTRLTGAMIYLRVDDVRETIERLRADGEAIAGEPHVIFSDTDGIFGPVGADEWMAFITDSEGNLVDLASQNPPAS